MPSYADIELHRYEDGSLVVTMAPPVNVAGWAARFDLSRRFDSDAPLFSAFTASGYGGGQSGITITNSGQGTLVVRIPGVALSGQTDQVNFAYTLQRTTSGCRVLASQGYLTLLPGGPVNSGM